jgi:hypothetical protein
MSRITGNDVANLMEAYSTVYAPQEVNEEQVWEEVENWVNSLVEEGHDLSEYTWEDMYEAYLGEMGQPGGNRPGGNRPTTNAPYRSPFARPMNAGTPVSQGARRGAAPSRVTRPQIGSLPANYRGQELQQAAAARASQVGTTRQGTAGGPTVGGNTPIGPATRPAAPAPARPAAQAPTAPARPAATAPTQNSARPTATPATTTTPTTTTAPATTPAAPQRTFNPLMQRTFGYQTGYAPSQVKQDPKKMAQMGTLRSISSSFDPFDIVQGYLIDEGYAETKEAAAVIMANMSEEWKTQILESGYFPTKESQREDEAKYKKGGSEVKHRTAQTQARPTPSK